MTGIEARFVEIKNQLDRVESRFASEVVERSDAESKLHQDIQNVKQGIDFMAADIEYVGGRQFKQTESASYENARRTFLEPQVPREIVKSDGPFSLQAWFRRAFFGRLLLYLFLHRQT